MNTGIITSFIIGGILLLAIVAMNVNISRSTSGLTMRGISQQHAKTVGQLLSYDIPKIGSDTLNAISNPITAAESNRLEFKSNIDNNGSIEIVEWFYDTSSPVTSGSNPDDYILYRRVDADQTVLNAGVETFTFTYFDNNRNTLTTPVSNTSLIRYIKVEFTVSSKEKLGTIGAGDGEYIKSPWEKTFSPKNLNN